MHVRSSRAALASVVLVAGASAVALGVACANGGAQATSGGDDASVAETGGPGYDAPSGTTDGGGGCSANLGTDWTNCGSCGHRCDQGQICNAGQCQAPCAAPLVLCPGQPGCFDVTNDLHNCGACGTQCLPPAGGTVVGTASCVASHCAFSCPADAGVPEGGAPIVRCDGDGGGSPGCFDLTSTSDHCGACSKQCPTGNICSQSTCCPQGDMLCGSACINVQTDPNNCGACDAGCPAPAQCSAGKCTGYTTSTPTGAFVDACAITGHVVVLTNQGVWKPTQLAALPFPFTFYGNSQTQFWLQSQGTMGLGAPQAFPPPSSYPDCTAGGDPTTHYAALVAFGDQSMATGANGVCYGSSGQAPSRQFAATWSQATVQNDPGSTLTFSIVLTETTNTIDFQYKTASGADGGIDPVVAGQSATVGIQAPQGATLAYTAYSCAKSFIPSTPFGVRFTPVQ